MIVKSVQHDIDRAGRLIFLRVFQQLNFIPHPVTIDDYGIDYNVQAFDGTHPTGAWFHVQLKSSASVAYSGDRAYISCSLDLDHLAHYGLEVRQPIFIVVIDITEERIFFCAPQLSAAGIKEARQGGKQSLTLRIPTKCELPGNAKSLLQTLSKVTVVLASRGLLAASAADFHRSIPALGDQDALYKGFQEKLDIVRLHRVHEQYKSGQVEEALRLAAKVRDDIDADIMVRFASVGQIHAIEWETALRSGKLGPALAEPSFEFARRLRKLVSPTNKWVRFASILVEVSAELEALVYADGADFMTLQQQIESNGSPAVILGLYARRTATVRRIIRKYNQGVRLARLASKYEDRWALATLLARIPQALSPYLVSLRSNSDEATEKVFISSCIGILEIAFQIARESGDERGMAIAATAAASLVSLGSPEALVWSENQVALMPEGEDKSWAQENLRRTKERKDGVPQEGDYNPDPAWQIIQKLALSLSVDISDEDSILVKRLRIAARDNSPERLMRYCEHIVVTLGAVSPTSSYIAETFGLSTCANKIAHCNLLDLHEEGVDADLAFSKLEQAHCTGCKYRIPRAVDWEYSLAIRRAFELENLPFVTEAGNKGNGPHMSEVDDLDESGMA